MILRNINTRVAVKLRRTDNRRGWHLFIDAYPIEENGRLRRKRFNINRVVTTVVWDISQPTSSWYLPKRDKNNIIVCESTVDQESCRFAEMLRQQYQAEYDRLSLLTPEERELARLNDAAEGDFIDYMSFIIKERHRHNSESIRINWKRAVALLKIFTNQEPLPLKDIDVKLLERLKSFLLAAPMGGGKKGTVSRNTAVTYFSIIRAALHQCYVDGYLPTDVASKVRGLAEEEKLREYLTQDELIKLANTPCDDDILKRAALFSALTGARHSDIMKLTWKEIVDEADISRWRFRQKKTKEPVDIPISQQARELCGERREDSQLIFEGLTPPSWISRPLKRWVDAAGIKKHITFHCFRHTYATLQLAAGTDIYTVSRMLGHTNVRTTERYAKIVDPLKIKATNAITLNSQNFKIL